MGIAGRFPVNAASRLPGLPEQQEPGIPEQTRYQPDEDVGLSGFAPETSPLSGVRSGYLSYRPVGHDYSGRELGMRSRPRPTGL